MAETCKHRVEVRDELDKALYAALGQPVRPAEPGAQPTTFPTTDEGEPGASEEERGERDHAATTFIAPGSTIAGFTFGRGTTPPTVG